jgi:tryptophanyl-tRNA synthetase
MSGAGSNVTVVRIFSGIQPTGAKHLGNYSGGFRQYAGTQELGEAFFCIVDLHSITVEHDPADLHTRTLDLAAMLLATGIEPSRSVVFVQSHVATHAQAAWLLSAVTGVGELRRMTQFKDKGDRQAFVSAGLFTYPVLMAADILLYETDRVPIGDDQRQHLELARDIAERFNARFGETFRLPDAIFPDVGARIMDLQEPTRKMSTTGGTELGTVGILDPPDLIARKFARAVTDSGTDVRHDPQGKPGVSNLLEILHVATGEPIEAMEARYDGLGYRILKQEAADAVIALVEPVRRRYEELRSDEAELRRQLASGAERARSTSSPVLERMLDRMGFVLP